MNLFALAGRLAPLDRAPVTVDADRCIRGHYRNSKCELCMGACPTEALKPGQEGSQTAPVLFNEDACVNCGACLPVCPVGALSGRDAAQDLLNWTAHVNPTVVEIACGRHPAPEHGVLDTATVVRTGQCLASLGPAAYLWLLGGPVKQITVRLDACAACPIGKALAQIQRTLSQVAHVMSARGEAERISQILENPPATRLHTRPVQLANNPPLSRRDLFRALVNEGPKLAAQALPFDDKPAEGKAPPRERRHLQRALGRLGLGESAMQIAAAPEDATIGLVRLAASGDCNACGVCVKVCPTGALQSKVNENEFWLLFSAAACTDCGVCLEICQPAALRRDGTPTLAEFARAAATTLHTAALRQCLRCGTRYSGQSTGNLCPTCEWRRENLFGARSIARR